jgi:hypothetical protein
MTLKISLVAATIAFGILGVSAHAETADKSQNSKLLIVNGNHVIYDDGRNDLFCVTRRHVVGYNYYGRPIFRRTMRCR